MADDGDPNAQARRKRNIAMALALGGLVLLFFFMTMVRLGGSIPPGH